LSLIGIVLLVFISIRYLTTTDYFKIKYPDYFTGQNILTVNLQKEAQRLSKLYPQYKRIAVRRLMPEGMVLDFQLRQAVAKIKLANKYFYLDEQGVLFYPAGQENDNLQLPLIIGLNSRISDPRSGVICNENSLLASLQFINNFNKHSRLSQQVKIKEINLKNINDIFLFTITGCKINLGTVDSLNKRLSILQRLISEINSDLSKIEYIDLRFREPVVKYR
jgi:cell division septal protein FtsQ